MHEQVCHHTKAIKLADARPHTVLLYVMAVIGAFVVSPAKLAASEAGEVARVGDEAELVDIDLLSLEVPVVVTVSRYEQKITDVPYSVGVVTAEDIRQSGARTIADALRLIPGVNVADLSMSNQAVAPRVFHGLIANQALVLVDGRQIFDALFGGTVWGGWPFQLEDIDRIEVIRGPGSVTWGGSAITGVINVITKDPGDQLGFTMTVGGASRGMVKQHMGLARREDNVRYRVSMEYEGGDGFRDRNALLVKPDDDYKAGRISLHLIHERSSDETLTLSGGSSVVDGGFPRMLMGGLGTSCNPGVQASYLLASWTSKRSDDEQLELTTYVNDFYATPGVTIVDYRYQQIAAQLRHTFRPAQAHELSWGIDTRVDLLDTGGAKPPMLVRDRCSNAVVGIYVQDSWRWTPKWMMDLGARLEYESYAGFDTSARVAIARKFHEDAIVYGAVSRSFESMAVGFRHLRMPAMNGLLFVTSQEDMTTPTLVAYELGYRGRPARDLEASVVAYWHEYDDLTQRDASLGPPGLFHLRYETEADASTYGLELSATWQVHKRWELLGNYTFARLNWRSDWPVTNGDVLTPPEHKAMVGVRYDATDDLHLSAHLYLVDDVETPDTINPIGVRSIDGYARLDLRGMYEFCDDTASIAVGARNLLDSGHYEATTSFLTVTEVPRMYYAEFRLAIR